MRSRNADHFSAIFPSSYSGAFGISVTAEGVETQAQQRFLSELRCDAMQGYLVSKPVAAQEFASLLSEEWALQR